MNLEQAYFLAEILSAAAVVISLLYLGLQIKRSRIQSENEAMELITGRRADYIQLLATNADLSFIIPKGLVSRTKLSPNEYFRFSSYQYTVFIGLEVAFIKWKRRDIDGQIWKAWDEALHWWLSFPGVRNWFQGNVVNGFTAEFNQYAQKVIAKLENQPLPDFEQLITFMEAAGTSLKENETIQHTGQNKG